MATPEQVVELRAITGYAAVDPYDDPQLSAMIDASSIYRVAARLWTEKATEYSSYVHITESGSSRNMGDLHKNALAMAKYFLGLADAEEAPSDVTGHARTRAIVREG